MKSFFSTPDGKNALKEIAGGSLEADESTSSKPESEVRIVDSKQLNDGEENESMQVDEAVDDAMDAVEEQSTSQPQHTLSKPIDKMKVAELRKELSKLNLPSTGLKAQLIERLTNALRQ